MKSFMPHSALLLVVGTLVASMAWPLAGVAQNKTPDPGTHKHADQSAAAENDLPAQLRELKAKAATLEAALMKRYPGAVSKDVPGDKGMGAMGGMQKGMKGDKKMGMGGMQGTKPDETMGQMMQMMGQMMQMMGQMQGKPSGMGGAGGMGMMEDDMMMGPGMMDDDQMEMAGMGGGAPAAGAPMAGGMGMMDMDMQEMMGMMGMGGMGQKATGMGKMQMATALPGFPGTSHIYHIGATGFFLDHPEHITLTTEQQTELNGLKEKALLEKSSSQRKIDEAEQALWELTGADEPDAKQIQVKIQEIEQLRGEQRLAFIRSVGEAAKVLTDEQRKVLLGQAKPDAHKAHPPATK